MAHQALAESGATSSIAEQLTTPASLPTGARDETVRDRLVLDTPYNSFMYLPQIPAEAQDDSEVTADGTQADTMSNDTTLSLCDDAVGEDNSQRADDIVAGNSHTIQGYVTEFISPKAR